MLELMYKCSRCLSKHIPFWKLLADKTITHEKVNISCQSKSLWNQIESGLLWTILMAPSIHKLYERLHKNIIRGFRVEFSQCVGII